MKTKVIFRTFRDGDVIAVFPEEEASYNTVASYMHLGQHGDISKHYTGFTTPAKPEEYEDLKRELEKIGYELEVRQKIFRKN